MPFIPKVDDHAYLFPVDASSVEDDTIILSGPATGTPPASWSNPTTNDAWHPAIADLGTPVNEWKNGTGHTGYGTGAAPNGSWKVDIPLPDGWYTRVTRRDKLKP